MFLFPCLKHVLLHCKCTLWTGNKNGNLEQCCETFARIVGAKLETRTSGIGMQRSQRSERKVKVVAASPQTIH